MEIHAKEPELNHGHELMAVSMRPLPARCILAIELEHACPKRRPRPRLAVADELELEVNSEQSRESKAEAESFRRRRLCGRS